MKWYIKGWKKCMVFSGRAHRTEYWMFMLFHFIISLIVGFIVGIFQRITNTDQTVLIDIYQLLTLLPIAAVAFRRMHDTNRSGWWAFFPIVNFFFLIEEGTKEANRFGFPPEL